MPDPQPTTEPAAPTPAAAPKLSHGEETFLGAMDKLGWDGTLDDLHGDDDGSIGGQPAEQPEGETPEGEEPPPAAAKPGVPKKVDATPPENAELAQLQELCKKHGLHFDGQQVVTRERAEFRESKKRNQQWLADQQTELLGKVATARDEFLKEREQFGKERQQYDALHKAHAAGDYEGIAKALGHKDWNEFQEAVIAQNTDPNWKRMRDLERTIEEGKAREKEREEAAARAEEERKANEEVQRKQAALTKYRTDLADGMSKSSNAFLQTMAEDPWFVAAIHQIQEAEWDGVEPLDPVLALDMKPQGSKVTLRQALIAARDRLNKATGFAGGQAAETGEEPAGGAPAAAPKPAIHKPVSRTAVVPASARSSASPNTKFGSDQEFFSDMRRDLQIALEQDRKAGII